MNELDSIDGYTIRPRIFSSKTKISFFEEEEDGLENNEDKIDIDDFKKRMDDEEISLERVLDES